MKHRDLLQRQPFDCHVHTPYSACCEDITVARLKAKASHLDVGFAVTDHSAHLYFPPDRAWSLMKDDFPQRFRAHRDRGRAVIEQYIHELRSQDIPVGLELDVYTDGTLVFEEDLFDELDLVVGSVHRLNSLLLKQGHEQVMEEFRRLTLRLLTSGEVDVLGHPFRMLLHAGLTVTDDLIRWVVEQCAANDAALEINSHNRFPDVDVKMVRYALSQDVLVVNSSDAHAMKEFGDFRYQDSIRQAAATLEAPV